MRENHLEGAHLFFVEDVIILSSLLKDIFPGCTVVGEQVNYLQCFDVSSHCLLASIASVEKSAVSVLFY